MNTSIKIVPQAPASTHDNGKIIYMGVAKLQALGQLANPLSNDRAGAAPRQLAQSDEVVTALPPAR